MSENLFYVITNSMFAAGNAYYVFYGKIPRFSALCFGICLGSALYTGYNYITIG